MRRVFGPMAVLLMISLAQPAMATCVYLALVKTCTPEKHGFWKDDPSPPVEADGTASNPTPPSANASGDNAWVMTPTATSGAVVVVLQPSSGEPNASKAGCGSDGDC